jgi:hypothetical protein
MVGMVDLNKEKPRYVAIRRPHRDSFAYFWGVDRVENRLPMSFQRLCGHVKGKEYALLQQDCPCIHLAKFWRTKVLV